LSAARAPAMQSSCTASAPEVRPLGEVGLAEHDGASAAQPRHDAGVAPDHGPEQRERPSRRVLPVARRDEVLDQQRNAVESGGRSVVAGRPLGIGARGLTECVGVDLNDSVQQWVQAGDLVEVVADERRRREATVLEANKDAVEGGLFELKGA